MSTVIEHEVVSPPNSAEAPVLVLDTRWAQGFSEAMAYAYGYQVDIAVSDTISTSATSLSLSDQKIQIQVSRRLVERAEAEDQMDFLGFNILHELGHVKRFIAQPPEIPTSSKDAYFQNIVDDIAINYDAARKTRFFSDLTKKAYDRYLFPVEQRDTMASEPKHKQFMEGLLLLGMTTTTYRKPQSPEELSGTLTDIGCTNLDPSVVEKLSEVVNFRIGKSSHNLLRQIREFGEDLPYYSRVTSHIRAMYDELYEADLEDQQQVDQSKQGDVEQKSDDDQFDYSNSGGCQHGEPSHEESPSDTQRGEDPSKSSDEPIDFADIGKHIGEQMADIIQENTSQSGSEQQVPKLSAEQLAKLRGELGLKEADFQAFLETVNRYRGEIAAITDIILQLRRERQDNFLAPSHEVSARGHRIHVGKLLGYLASNGLDTTPDIWRTPAFQERQEYEFDGADFYFLCDVSGSMQGDKADAASDSAVVLSQGIQDASLEAYDDVPPVRIQVQAFGSDDQILCQLTDSPKNADLGRMYSSLRSPDSNSTQVSGALAKIKPEFGRLSVVLVLSDGQFHDEEAAMTEGARLANEGAIVVQCVFGGASVSKLSDNAKRMNIQSAKDLPDYLFGVMPELIDALRRSNA